MPSAVRSHRISLLSLLCGGLRGSITETKNGDCASSLQQVKTRFTWAVRQASTRCKAGNMVLVVAKRAPEGTSQPYMLCNLANLSERDPEAPSAWQLSVPPGDVLV